MWQINTEWWFLCIIDLFPIIIWSFQMTINLLLCSFSSSCIYFIHATFAFSELERWLMMMSFIHEFLLLHGHSSVLLLRPEQMGFLIWLGDHSVTPAKVFYYITWFNFLFFFFWNWVEISGLCDFGYATNTSEGSGLEVFCYMI